MGSVYSCASGKINAAIYNNEPAIDANDFLLDIRSEIDLSEMTREELEERYIKQVMWNALNQKNYFSISRKAGLFINFDLMKNSKNLKAFKDKLQKTRIGDIQSDKKVIEELERTFQKKKNDYSEQAFDFDEDGMPYYYDELTENDIVQVTKAMIEDSKKKKLGLA